MRQRKKLKMEYLPPEDLSAELFKYEESKLIERSTESMSGTKKKYLRRGNHAWLPLYLRKAIENTQTVSAA